MFPIRLTLVTYNLWGATRFAERSPAISGFLNIYMPDVFCIQEFSKECKEYIDFNLPYYKRVDDLFNGWTNEGNIYWKKDLFELVGYGAEDIGLLEEDRRLFWARLQIKGSQKTMLVSTAHFTYKGHPLELETGCSPRLKQSHQAVSQLERIQQEMEPVFFMGDLNDSSHPTHIFNDGGYIDCFSNLGIPCVPTAPCYPQMGVRHGRPLLNQTLDWIMSNNNARSVAALVPSFYYNGISPSDHWPVVAVYEI